MVITGLGSCHRVPRRNAKCAQRYETTAIAAHQAKATCGALPTGAPVSSPRRLSTTGVNGWFEANQRTPAGIESAGTKVLDRNGSRNESGKVDPFAPATLFVTRPMAADSQASANEKA